MSAISDKTSGLANEVVGKVKQGGGPVIGTDELKDNGNAQEMEGQAQRALREKSDTDRESKIKERAYHIWQQEGSPDERQYEHWHQAVKEIDAENKM